MIRRATSVAAIAALIVGLAGCSSTFTTDNGDGTITAWASDAAHEVPELVQTFSTMQADVTVDLRVIPDAEYEELLWNTPLDELPDMFEAPSSLLPRLIAAGRVVPLDPIASRWRMATLLPAVHDLGQAESSTYAIALADQQVAMWGNSALLADAGITPPRTPSEAWTATEFIDVLHRLSAHSPSQRGLALHDDPYSLMPIAGPSEEAWDLPEVLDALQLLASARDTIVLSDTTDAFDRGEVALAWDSTAHSAAHRAALGNDLVAVPLPKFLGRSVTVHGARQWSVSPAAASSLTPLKRFVDYLLMDDTVARAVAARGGVPSTRTALAADRTFRATAPNALFAQMLSGFCSAHPHEFTLGEATGCTAFAPAAVDDTAASNAKWTQLAHELLGGHDAAEAVSRVSGP